MANIKASAVKVGMKLATQHYGVIEVSFVRKHRRYPGFMQIQGLDSTGKCFELAERCSDYVQLAD